MRPSTPSKRAGSTPNLRLVFKIARAFGKLIGNVFIYEDIGPGGRLILYPRTGIIP